MDMDMDGKFHIHGKHAISLLVPLISLKVNVFAEYFYLYTSNELHVNGKCSRKLKGPRRLYF